MGKATKEKLKNIYMPIAVVLMVVVLICAISVSIKAKSIGSITGEEMGTVVGRAMGSFEGMTKGRIEGSAAGKEKGLLAEDTETDITSKIQGLNKLEVLVAKAKLKNFHTIGKDTAYAALYFIKGNVVFSVDMSKAVISLDDGGLHIVLPKPEGELYIDDSSVEKAAEYQKHFFSGSAKDGYDAYLNTMKEIQESSVETLANYDALIKSAKQAAEHQVTLLAQNIALGCDKISVTFKE